MAKTGHNRRNEIDDLIMLDDSGRGTLRATHTNMNSVKNFPSAQYETMNHCPISNPKTLMETRNLSLPKTPDLMFCRAHIVGFASGILHIDSLFSPVYRRALSYNDAPYSTDRSRVHAVSLFLPLVGPLILGINLFREFSLLHVFSTLYCKCFIVLSHLYLYFPQFSPFQYKDYIRFLHRDHQTRFFQDIQHLVHVLIYGVFQTFLDLYLHKHGQIVEVRLKSKRKLRSNSPCLNRSKTYRAASANDPYRGHIYAPRQGQGTIKHHVANSEYYPAGYQVNVEKTLSCPANLYGPEPYNPHSFTSQNSVQMEQFSENLFNIDEVVNKLKDEIERVKHQLRHLSQQRLENDRRTKIPSLAKTPPSTPEDREEIHSKEETQVTVMKNENRRLKHEIEVTRKLLEKSRVKVLKIKDILADYEKKVNLLQLQALKSSKAVKKSEETFCLCLKDKDTKIKTLKATNDILEQTVKDKTCLLNEKNEEMNKLNESINSLKQAFEETTTRCSLLNEINQNFLLSIDILRAELNNSASEVEKQKETIQNQEQKICDLNCVYNEMVARTSKRKDSSKLLINNNFQEQEKKTRQTSPLSIPVEEAEKQKTIMCKFPELEETVKEYEAFSVQCKDLEGNCKDVHEKFLLSENNFNKQKRDMSRLIGELTEIVKEYKVTISQISEINKQQEIIINNQGMALSTKEVELILIKKESHSFKNKSRLLEQEVEDLKRDLSDVCSEEASLSIYKELEELKKALNIEKDNQLIKDKIIQDQCETILNLQSQVKQKFQELTQALDVNQYLQREIDKINENLMMKHEELGLEIDENRSLIEKLRGVQIGCLLFSNKTSFFCINALISILRSHIGTYLSCISKIQGAKNQHWSLRKSSGHLKENLIYGSMLAAWHNGNLSCPLSVRLVSPSKERRPTKPPFLFSSGTAAPKIFFQCSLNIMNKAATFSLSTLSPKHNSNSILMLVHLGQINIVCFAICINDTVTRKLLRDEIIRYCPFLRYPLSDFTNGNFCPSVLFPRFSVESVECLPRQRDSWSVPVRIKLICKPERLPPHPNRWGQIGADKPKEMLPITPCNATVILAVMEHFTSFSGGLLTSNNMALILEYQKSQLSEETRNFEAILQNLIQKYRENKKQKALLKNLEEEISEQKREWDWQKHSLGQEKDIAVCAAKFATQKLIDTLENFRRHMNIQKKVQLLLIKMLYEKDNQLRFIQSKVCSINNTKKIFQPRELLLNNIAKQKLFFQKPFELTSSASNPNKNISSFSNSNIKPECAVWRCHGKYFRIDSKACAKSG
ncbi:uncharacterized protein [Euwallacea similis]|uniref:uncharacterized protein n=1 Tax=Euwallacea similis TaxID=1736056 RepID=UPI00344C7661